MSIPAHLDAIYQRRFSPDLRARRQMWQVLCEDFFQKYIPRHSVVLELAAGYCEFINAIQASAKIAIDLNPATTQFANDDVKVIQTSATDLSAIASGSIDIAFTSNFFEHLTREEIVLTIREVARILQPRGRFLILQPNVRFCMRDYWMFFDHVTPLDDRSLTEALETNGFEVRQTIVRFLPYTTKSHLPRSPLFIRAYLRLRPAWRIFGQQSFLVAGVRAPGKQPYNRVRP